jgi:hypothetical protein
MKSVCLNLDRSNCTTHWSAQRDRWIDIIDNWKNGTRNCDGLGDDLPDPIFEKSAPPIQQWQKIHQNYVDSLNAWLKAASDLNLPGIPSAIQFDETNPHELWDKVKYYFNHFSDLWYEHVGKPHGLVKPTLLGRCNNKQVEEWIHSTFASEKAISDYEDVFNGHCDAQ